MKGLVLAGGKGTRLRPITYTSAKQLVPVANKPVLFYGIEAIVAAGIQDIGVIVGDTKDEIMAALGDGSRFGARLTYIPQEAPLGLAHAVLTAADFVRGEPFVMYLGDNVLMGGIRRFVESFERERPDAQIFLARVPEPEHFGVAVLDGERVVRLVEKPKEHLSDLALVGVYLFDDSILEAAETLEPSWRNEYEITEAIQWLIDQGRVVRAEMVDGYWKDTGRPEDLLEANRMMLGELTRRIDGDVDAGSVIDGAVLIEAGAKIVRSRVTGPCAIGADTLVEGSTVGPHVALSASCVVVASTVEDTIAMEGSRIEGVRSVSGSILGRNVDVRRASASDEHRLIVGDQSRVEI